MVTFEFDSSSEFYNCFNGKDLSLNSLNASRLISSPQADILTKPTKQEIPKIN